MPHGCYNRAAGKETARRVNYHESIDYLLSFADFERSGRFQDRPDGAPGLAPLAEDAWARLPGVLPAAVDAEAPAREGRRLVTFDLLTALAFLAFRERAVRCQVLEVGLGGRVDSTNVFHTAGTRLGESRPTEAGPPPPGGGG